MAKTDLLESIDNLYSAACGGSWSEALHDISNLAGGGGATLGVTDASGIPTFFRSYGVSSESIDEFLGHYVHVSPRVDFGFSLPKGRTFVEQNFLSESEMDQAEFYVDFLFKHGWGPCVGGVIKNDETGFAGFTIERSKRAGPISGAALMEIEALLPHFERALAISNRFERTEHRLDTLTQALNDLETGMVFLDHAGRISDMNDKACKLVQRQNGLYAVNGRLKTVNPTCNDMLQKLLASTVAGLAQGHVKDSAGGEIEVYGRDGTCLNLMISPVTSLFRASGRVVSVVYISMQEPLDPMSPDALIRIYGLTSVEARLTVAIVNGMSIREYAQVREISEGTARGYLHNVLSKTNSHRQGDLIRKLLRSPLPWRRRYQRESKMDLD